MARLENWSVVIWTTSPYDAPEMGIMTLCGTVYDHPRLDDGKIVTTSRIMSADGRKVTTKNTTYLLGDISLDYKTWCESNGIEIDQENPIKIKRD